MKLALVLLALIALIALAITLPRTLAATAASNQKPEPVAASSCVDRYNSLLERAKEALIAGKRTAAAELLEEAKRIPICPDIQDGGLPQAPLITMNSCDGARVQ